MASDVDRLAAENAAYREALRRLVEEVECGEPWEYRDDGVSPSCRYCGEFEPRHEDGCLWLAIVGLVHDPSPATAAVERVLKAVREVEWFQEDAEALSPGRFCILCEVQEPGHYPDCPAHEIEAALADLARAKEAK